MERLRASNVTLSELKEGGVEEQFQRCLEDALRSIADVNTDPKKPRTITITIKLKPNSDRSVAMLDATVTTKLPTAVPVETALILKHDGKGRILGHEAIQDTIPGLNTN